MTASVHCGACVAIFSTSLVFSKFREIPLPVSSRAVIASMLDCSCLLWVFLRIATPVHPTRIQVPMLATDLITLSYLGRIAKRVQLTTKQTWFIGPLAVRVVCRFLEVDGCGLQ